ncbi:MAG TPA: lysophospholipid acyltransferase family protein [Chitinophagaceae bacterium]|nr:lysophospholipid acyltransferase family protein [Chitinophagaceae bacterium]
MNLFIKKVYTVGFSIYGFIIFLLLMFILLPLFAACFFLGRIRGGNILYRLCRFWADAFFFLTFITSKTIYEEKPAGNNPYVFISNHISYLDVPMMMKAIRRRNVRILAKAEMAKIPVFGFIYKQGTVRVYRDDDSKRKESIRELICFLHQKISVFICPEGTFNTTGQPLKNFYDGAFKIAIETQTPVCPILFLDTYDRLNYHSVFSLTPGKSRSVFLPQTSTEGLTTDDLPFLKDKIFRQMEDALIRYKASWIKQERLWIYQEHRI